jgi:mannosyl-3-phosphoglycerate phosphatase
MRHRVIFADIDGTLIDINTGEYGENTKALIHTLKENNIPVILCSAKTWAEQNKVRDDLELSEEPFIIENGGAIIIPKDYFHFSLDTPNSKEIRDCTIIELGKSTNEIRSKLNNIREKFKIEFKGVSDISLEDLGKIAGMSIDYARRMAQREYSETIIQIGKNDLARFTHGAEEVGLNVIHGGRFFDVTIGNDKGKAVGILRKLFKKKYHNDVIFFGLGDSENDYSMLKHMDVPMLVQRPDRSWSNLVIKNIIKIQGIGPEGCQNAFNKILKLSDSK